MSDPPAVVSLTLVGGESEHLARVTRAKPAGSPLVLSPEAYLRDDVLLSVREEGGAETALIPRGDGTFLLTMRALAGATYHLRGTIAGTEVSASTTLPLQFRVVTPAADTVTEADGSLTLATVEIRYLFEAAGASAFEWRTVGPVGPGLRGTTDLDTGSFRVPRMPEVRRLLFLAYNADAAAWLARDVPSGNITGALGGFGGALAVRRWIYVP